MSVIYDTGRQYIAATVTYGKNVIYAFYRADGVAPRSYSSHSTVPVFHCALPFLAVLMNASSALAGRLSGLALQKSRIIDSTRVSVRSLMSMCLLSYSS